jgi:hypothetical protein
MGILGPIGPSKHAARGMGIEIDLDPTPLLLIAQFNALGASIKSFREPLHDSIKEVVGPSLRQNFASMGRPDRWQDVSEATWYRKVHTGFSSVASRPLMRSGALSKFAGQINAWDINGIEGIATFQLSEDVWYGKVHQEGSGSVIGFSAGAGSSRAGDIALGTHGYVPQRLWALIQDEDVPRIENVFDRWLQAKIIASGVLVG